MHATEQNDFKARLQQNALLIRMIVTFFSASPQSPGEQGTIATNSIKIDAVNLMSSCFSGQFFVSSYGVSIIISETAKHVHVGGVTQFFEGVERTRANGGSQKFPRLLPDAVRAPTPVNDQSVCCREFIAVIYNVSNTKIKNTD